MNKKIIVFIVICIIVIISILTTLYFIKPNNNLVSKGKSIATDTNATADSVETLVDAINNFSCKIYNEISSSTNSNIVLSPYSVFVVLSMTYEAAKGETAEEFNNILQFPQNNDAILCSFGKIYNLLNTNKEYILNTANALWIRQRYSPSKQYLDLIENFYMGTIKEVDFNNPTYAAQLINEWIEINTGGKIKNFFTETAIHPLTTFILTNAIYFKGIWKYQFDPEYTKEKDFTVSENITRKVPMMTFSSADVILRYTDTDNLQILELPYKGNALSMLIFLPKEKNLSDIESLLTYENIITWKRSLRSTEIEVFLPKFHLETAYNLNQYLMNLGMHISFTPDADFSAMNEDVGLFVEKIIHKAYIELNEEGTEAAGASSVNIIPSDETHNVVFNANHPFIFLIQHEESGAILFIGKFCDPQI